MQGMRGAFLFCATFFAGRGRQISWLPRYFILNALRKPGRIRKPNHMNTKPAKFKKRYIIYALIAIGFIGTLTTPKDEAKATNHQAEAKKEQDSINALPPHQRDSIMRIRKMVQAEQERQETLKRKKKQIAEKFSDVTGENWDLAYYIKTKLLHDPDSYEHVKTKWLDWNDHILIYTTFRARNKFGALVMSTYEVVLTYDDNIVSIKQVE